jgi:hypothetical protein
LNQGPSPPRIPTILPRQIVRNRLGHRLLVQKLDARPQPPLLARLGVGLPLLRPQHRQLLRRRQVREARAVAGAEVRQLAGEEVLALGDAGGEFEGGRCWGRWRACWDGGKGWLNGASGCLLWSRRETCLRGWRDGAWGDDLPGGEVRGLLLPAGRGGARGGEVVKVAVLGLGVVQVKVAVPLGEHVLLGGGGRAPLRGAGEALAVLEDDEVEVADQGLDVDDEALGGGDEEAVGLVHVGEVGGKGGGGGGAKEAGVGGPTRAGPGAPKTGLGGGLGGGGGTGGGPGEVAEELSSSSDRGGGRVGLPLLEDFCLESGVGEGGRGVEASMGSRPATRRRMFSTLEGGEGLDLEFGGWGGILP